MDLALVREHAEYKSAAARSGKIAESWAAANLYCAACPSNRLVPTASGTPVVDFRCGRCGEPYQLKSRKDWSERRVLDSEYGTMMRAITEDRAPNLAVLHYSYEASRVLDLLLVPRFFFTASAIEKRRPLSSTARRKGWTGCNILLGAIAPEGKLRLVTKGVVTPPDLVRESYSRVRPIAGLKVESRGWTLDVLRVVRSLGQSDFALERIYRHERELAALHPDNRHVRDKIRQQLQVLRDLGLLEFLERGHYRLRH